MQDPHAPSWAPHLLGCLLYPLNSGPSASLSPASSFANLKADSASMRTQESGSTGTGGGRSRKTSAKFSKMFGSGGGGESGDAKIGPPSVARPPPSDAMQLARRFAGILGMKPEIVDEQAARLAEACAGSELIGADLAAYLRLLQMDIGNARPADYDDVETYELWKQNECHSLEQLICSTTGRPEFASSGCQLVLMTVVAAEGLLGKDINGSSNPYCAVTFEGVNFVSHSVARNKSPAWDFRIALPIRASSADPIVVSIWNRASDHRAHRKNDGFLGLVTLSPSTILQSSSVDKKYPLAKRSSRSHVDGSVQILVELVVPDPNVQLVFSRVLHFIPPNPRAAYRDLLNKVLEHDVGRDDGVLLTEESRAGLDAVAIVWRVDEMSRAVLYFEALTIMYSQGALPATVLQQEGSSKVEGLLHGRAHLSKPDLDTYRDTSKTLSALLLHQLRIFFNHSLTSRKAKDLDAMTGILANMQTNRFLDHAESDVGEVVKNLLKEAIAARYLGLHAIANSPSASSPDSPSECLITLIRSIEAELASYDKHLDTLYFDYVHVPDIAATVFFDRLMPDLEGYTKSAVHARNFGDAFELYEVVAGLRRVYDRVDFRLAEKFHLAEWFGPPLREWVAVSERKFVEWMEAAVKVDKYTHSSPTVLYSSSILDMFTSFQQQTDFAMNLNWPDREQEKTVLMRLLQGISDTLARYIDIMVVKIGEDLVRSRTAQTGSQQQLRTLQAAPVKKKSKLKLRFGKSKKGREIDPGEIRIPNEACVKLENIDAIPSLFKALCDRVFPARAESTDSPPTPPPKDLPTSHSPSLTPLLIVARQDLTITLHSIRNFQMTRPAGTQVSARIRVGGKDVGETRPLPQSRVLVWEDAAAATYYHLLPAAPAPDPQQAIATFVDPELEICVMHHVPGDDKPYLFGRGTTPSWMGRNNVEVDLGLGKVGIVSSMGLSGVEFLEKRIFGSVDRGLEKGVRLVADQLTHDLRARIKALAKKTTPKSSWSKPSSAALQSVFSKLHTSNGSSTKQDAPTLTEADYEVALSTLLNYLDVNLEILMEQTNPVLSLRIVGGTWDVVPKIVESLITDPMPTTSPSSTPTTPSHTSHSATSPARIAFLKTALQAMWAWFSADGDGLDDERLRTQSYNDCVHVLENAHLSRKVLERMLIDSGNGVPQLVQQGDDGEWACRLVTAKGGRDAVDVFVARKFRQ